MSHIKPAEDKYTFYIRNYYGKNAANVGYTALSGSRNDKYGDAYIRLTFIMEDGTILDPEDEDLLRQYVVVGQDIEPYSILRLIYSKDSQSNEYSNLVENQTIDIINLHVRKYTGESISYNTVQEKSEEETKKPKTQDKKSIDDVFPVRDMWGLSQDSFKSKYPAEYELAHVGKSNALLLKNIIVETWPMDVYYVFTTEGLSKITYILMNKDTDTIKQCIFDLRNSVEERLGKPSVEEKAVTQWDVEAYSLKIGSAKLKNYIGTDIRMATMLFSKPENGSSSVSSVKAQEEDKVIGTYVGENGSLLVVFKGRKADYYWKDWEEPVEDYTWEN